MDVDVICQQVLEEERKNRADYFTWNQKWVWAVPAVAFFSDPQRKIDQIIEFQRLIPPFLISLHQYCTIYVVTIPVIAIVDTLSIKHLFFVFTKGPLPVWQAGVPPPDMCRYGSWLARCPWYLVSGTYFWLVEKQGTEYSSTFHYLYRNK